jgi:hypothetical protein
MNRYLQLLAVPAVVALVAITGCGKSVSTVPVKGKVTTASGPVKGGSLTFAPVAPQGGNAATAPVIAQVKDDGTFEVAGGAAAGRHKVLYNAPQIEWKAPEWDGQGAPPQPPPNPYAGLAPKTPEVEFAAGPNEVSVELVPGGRT